MKNLVISLYKSKSEKKPESVVTIPLTTIHIAMKLLPKKIKNVLEREEIDLLQCKELPIVKDLAGKLIEVESPSEKMVISVE